MNAVAMRVDWLVVVAGVVVLALAWAPEHAVTKTNPGEAVVHVKLAPGVDAVVGYDAEPLFNDPRLSSTSELTRWWQLRVPAAHAHRVVAQLQSDPHVVSALVPPVVEPAVMRMPLAEGDSCPISTPSYERLQGYLAAAPKGIDAAAAWALPGGRGDGMWVADVEGAWNQTHEDLPGDRIEHVAGRIMKERGWEAHGTAVLGEVAARDNGIGMVGIAPNVERIFTASIGRIGAARALYRAQDRLRRGDVLIIELHARGPRGRYLPVEYWDDVYDVVAHATGRGVIVVAAAGNGGENLDHKAYKGKLTRSVRDSGAILVGAGAPARQGFVDRSRLWFSNYGSRLDVQGWGRKVATLDYGDLQNCDATDRKYTDEFGGTSSATPVVAGAVLTLQGILRARATEVYGPLKMRELLRRTGSPQVDGPEGAASQTIGPRPDLARAIEQLD